MQTSHQAKLFQEPETFSPDSHIFLYEQTTVDHKRAFKCLFHGCEKVFRFKSDIKRHLIIHTKDKPYTCKYPDCHRSFKRPDALRNHMQTHDQNPLSSCDVRFQKKTVLQHHLVKQKNEKLLCPSTGCQKSFLTYKHLKQHKTALEYCQKLNQSSSQDSGQRYSDDLDCFFNHFDDPNSELDPHTARPFREDFNPRPEKFLPTEERRAVFSPQTEASYDMPLFD